MVLCVPGALRRYFHDKEVTVWDAKALSGMPRDHVELLGTVVNEMGRRSAESQGLATPITTLRALETTDQRLYLASQKGGSEIVGLLKVGRKHLCMRISGDQQCGVTEANPLCCLDIYVETELQRVGLGKALFEYMLAHEGAEAWQMAYDRPSPKLLGFLRKHYALSEWIPQTNNYVLFMRYFREKGIATSLPTVTSSSSAPTPPPGFTGSPQMRRTQASIAAAASSPAAAGSPLGVGGSPARSSLGSTVVTMQTTVPAGAKSPKFHSSNETPGAWPW